MPKGDYIRKMATNKWKMKLFMLQHLPLGFIVGLKVLQVDENSCQVRIPYKYINKNPFRSMYFAAQSMAAELSTGLLAMAAVKDANIPVSMLVLKMKSNFTKKAATTTVFQCSSGEEISQAVKQAVTIGEGQTVTTKSIGKDKSGDIVSEFEFTWTFKAKK